MGQFGGDFATFRSQAYWRNYVTGEWGLRFCILTLLPVLFLSASCLDESLTSQLPAATPGLPTSESLGNPALVTMMDAIPLEPPTTTKPFLLKLLFYHRNRNLAKAVLHQDDDHWDSQSGGTV